MLTLQLADFGADVIKVEQPVTGDPLRAWRSAKMDLWWREYARNKKSVTLNIAAPQGRELLMRLIDRADVLVENFIPGHLRKWQLSQAAFLQRNPRLVVLSLSAWGQDGPYSNRPGFGTLVEAMSGFAEMMGFPDKPPTLPPMPIADMVAGLYGATAVMVALHHARRTGEGQMVDLALLESIFSILGPVAATYRLTGKLAKRNGNRSANNAPRNAYKTKDGHWFAVSASTPAMAEKFFRLLGLEDLLKDEKFATNEARVRNGDELDAIVARTLEQRSLDDIRDLFVENGVAGGPVYDVAQLLGDRHVKERGLVTEVEDPELGTYPMHAPLPRFSGTPATIRSVGPKLGEHNAAVFGELGLTEKDLAGLKAAGVI